MDGDRLRLVESVVEAWTALDDQDRAAAMKILARISDDPISGVPLAEPIKGYWSAREGSLRVIYRLVPQSGFVLVLRVTSSKEIKPV